MMSLTEIMFEDDACLHMHIRTVKFQAGAGATLGRTLWGMLGLGAFGFQLQEVPEGKRIITTTRSHSNKLVTDAVQAMDPHDVIKVGGAGNKVRDFDWPIYCTQGTNHPKAKYLADYFA